MSDIPSNLRLDQCLGASYTNYPRLSADAVYDPILRLFVADKYRAEAEKARGVKAKQGKAAPKAPSKKKSKPSTPVEESTGNDISPPSLPVEPSSVDTSLLCRARFLCEKAKSGISRCRRCGQSIERNSLRFGYPSPDPRGEFGAIPIWFHVRCAPLSFLGFQTFTESLSSACYAFGDFSKEERDEVVATAGKLRVESVGGSSSSILDPLDAMEYGADFDESTTEKLVHRRGVSVPLLEKPTELVNANLLPFQLEGYSWMVSQELNPQMRGGILADEMGMGKTLQTIALIVGRRKEVTGPTLVVAPVAAVMQWYSEIDKFLGRQGDDMSSPTSSSYPTMHVYHGAQKISATQLAQFDIVLTTYQTLENEYRKQANKAKVKCRYCLRMFLPTKLAFHLKYMCGPNAMRTLAQQYREVKGGSGVSRMAGTEKAKKTLGIGGGKESSSELPPTLTNVLREVVKKSGLVGNKEAEKMTHYDMMRLYRETGNTKGDGTDGQIKGETEEEQTSNRGKITERMSTKSVTPLVEKSLMAVPISVLKESLRLHGSVDGWSRMKKKEVVREIIERGVEVRWEGKKNRASNTDGRRQHVAGIDSGSEEGVESTSEEEDRGSPSGSDSEESVPERPKANRGKSVGKGAGRAVAAKSSVKSVESSNKSSSKSSSLAASPSTNTLSSSRSRRVSAAKALEQFQKRKREDSEDSGDSASEVQVNTDSDAATNVDSSAESSPSSSEESSEFESSSASSEEVEVDTDSDEEGRAARRGNQRGVGRNVPRGVPQKSTKSAKPPRLRKQVADEEVSSDGSFSDGSSSSCVSDIDLNQSPLHSVRWSRLVLDEAHRIKQRTNSTSLAAFALSAQYRWCLSGTPLQNRVGELYSLVRFLRFSPFAHYFCKGCECKSLHFRFVDNRFCQKCGCARTKHYSYFKQVVSGPIVKYGIGDGVALNTLKTQVLDAILLRRTKLERQEDLNLPPMTVEVRKIKMSPDELDFYESLFKQSVLRFDTFAKSGTLLHNYAHIFDLLTRLRQALDHPYLIVYGSDYTVPQAPGGAKGGTELESSGICALCQDDVEAHEPSATSNCGHMFHLDCVQEYIRESPSELANGGTGCPACFAPLTIKFKTDDDAEDQGEQGDDQNSFAMSSRSTTPSAASPTQPAKIPHSIMSRITAANFKSSTKIEAVVNEILNHMNSGSKCLIFSQFTRMLDLVEFRIKQNGIGCAKLTGSQTLVQRSNIIQAFNSDSSMRALLISLKAGGEGLNLQAADHVFLLDPWWNPASEMQAVQRAHRIGQTKPVRAIRFITENSIEEKVIALQDMKHLVFEATVGQSQGAAQKLTESDLRFLFNH